MGKVVVHRLAYAARVTGPRVVVVGAGIVGAAIARALTRHPSRPEVTVLEKEPEPGLHQTSRNSGVVHAGLYYAPGSAKATLSREGVRRLREYCQDRGVPYAEVGKVLVAHTDDDVARLRAIQQRARGNEVPGVRWLGAEELAEVEPHAVGRAGLYSPTTAITDFRRVASAMLDEVVESGAILMTGFEVTQIRRAGARTGLVAVDGRTVEADRVVIAGGLHADRLAVLAGDSPFPRIVAFRGEYHQLVPSARHLVRGLVYPVPDPRYPFLGVHLTRCVDGRVLLGPNAVLATAREGYRRGDVSLAEVRELLSFKGFRAFGRDNLAAGTRELWTSLHRRAFLAQAQRFVPEIQSSDVIAAPAGVRAQAMDADGSLVEDFRFSRVGMVFCIRNAPSPAATASLAIADLVVGELGLGPAALGGGH